MNVYQHQSAVFTLFVENIPIFPKQSQNSSHLNLVYSLENFEECELLHIISNPLHTVGSVNLNGPGLLAFGS